MSEVVQNRDLLIISNMDGLENCATALRSLIGTVVECASNRKAGLQALRLKEYAVVIVEESLAEGDPEWADQVWSTLGLGIAIQINFAIWGTARLAREIRTALARRDGEQARARRAATLAIENDFRSSLTGILLQSELALSEPAIPPGLEPRLRQLVELAGALRERLRS